MKSAYILAGIKFLNLIKLISKNKFTFRIKYILRFLFLLQNAFWSSIFSIVENIRFKKRLKFAPLPDKHIFIVGHWRTGSTFLHQLMNLDSASITPSAFNVAVPECFMSSRIYYKPIMTPIIGKHRVMDNVKMGFDEPQEDEFALFKMTNYSPLESLVFPKNDKYFLKNHESYLPDSDKKREQWIDALKLFCKKLYYKYNGKYIVLKNPFHSMRIKTLYENFPNSYFVHIYRDPYLVVPSTIRMWDIVGKQNCMNNRWKKSSTKEVTEELEKMLSEIKKDLKELPKANYTEIKFEDLEKQPIIEIKNIYQKLGLEYTSEFEKNLTEFLEEIKDYKKNEYNLSQEDKEIINLHLKQS